MLLPKRFDRTDFFDADDCLLFWEVLSFFEEEDDFLDFPKNFFMVEGCFYDFGWISNLSRFGVN